MPDSDHSNAQRLAKEILDELDKPTSKEREEQMAQKERDDSMTLQEFYVVSGQIKQEQLVQRVLLELADKIERLDPPDGVFEQVEIVFAMNHRKAVLRFAPSPSRPAKRYVELSVATESGLSTSSQWLESGTNAHLALYLRKPEVVAATIATGEELKQSLAMHRLA